MTQDTWKFKENALAKIVVDYFKNLGYDYACEFCGIDLIFFKGKETIAVELKKCLNKKVIKQAYYRFFDAHKSICAVGSNPTQKSLTLAKEKGLGVISLSENKVNILLESKLSDMPVYGINSTLKWYNEAKEKGWLNGEIIAGLPNMRGCGPTQACKLAVYEYRKAHPKATWKEIFENVDNHYSSVGSMQSALGRCVCREPVEISK